MKEKAREKRRKFMERSCLKKLRHETEEAARMHLRGLFLETGDEKDVYKCRFCGGWHIGLRK